MVAILILRNPKPQNFKMWQGSQVALIWMEYRQPEQFKTVSRSHASDQWRISIIVQVSLCCNKIVRKGFQFTGCLDCLESWPNKDITIINPHKAIQDNSQVQWCVICLAWDSWPQKPSRQMPAERAEDSSALDLRSGTFGKFFYTVYSPCRFDFVARRLYKSLQFDPPCRVRDFLLNLTEI